MPNALGRRILAGCFLAGLCVLAATPQGPLPTGVAYELQVGEGPRRLHWLSVDPRKTEVSLARALNDGVGREKVSSIARRKGAAAAFNAGFFSSSDRYDGDPAGILKIGEAWFSSSTQRRAALGWKRDGSRTLVGEIGLRCRVRLGEVNLAVNGLNRERGRSELILYSWAFHRSTLTNPGGFEVAFRDGEVVAITRSGDSAIPVGGYVASFGPGADLRGAEVQLGSSAEAQFQIEPFDGSSVELWRGMDFIVSGFPVLLRDGEHVEVKETEGDGKRHPRTAVGVRENGDWVVLAVDGRQPGVSVGMTLREVAEALKARGCRDAVNLDGGGSTTLYVGGEVVNTPSDFGVERPVSDAVVVRGRGKRLD